MKAIATLIILVVFSLLGWLIYETLLRPDQGVLVHKEFSPAHSTITYNPALKMPTTVHYSSSWDLILKHEDRLFTVSVSKKMFDTIKIGDIYNRKLHKIIREE